MSIRTLFCRPITCAGCHQPRTHHAKGFCKGCYDKVTSAGRYLRRCRERRGQSR